MNPFDLKPGDLVEIIVPHRIPTERSMRHARVWTKGVWPYNLSDDLLLDVGQVCLVLEPATHYDFFRVYTLPVLIENETLGLRHFKTDIDPAKVKKIAP